MSVDNSQRLLYCGPAVTEQSFMIELTVPSGSYIDLIKTCKSTLSSTYGVTMGTNPIAFDIIGKQTAVSSKDVELSFQTGSRGFPIPYISSSTQPAPLHLPVANKPQLGSNAGLYLRETAISGTVNAKVYLIAYY